MRLRESASCGRRDDAVPYLEAGPARFSLPDEVSVQLTIHGCIIRPGLASLVDEDEQRPSGGDVGRPREAALGRRLDRVARFRSRTSGRDANTGFLRDRDVPVGGAESGRSGAVYVRGVGG